MKKKDEIKSEVVFSGNTWQAGIVKSLLENADIQAYILDGITGTLNPWWTAPGGAGSVRVAVSGQDLEKALLIVSEYEKNMKE